MSKNGRGGSTPDWGQSQRRAGKARSGESRVGCSLTGLFLIAAAASTTYALVEVIL